MKKKGSFENPIEPTKRQMEFPFQAPTRDKVSTGYFMSPGDNYGVGFRQPVGKEGNPSQMAKTLPMKSKCFSPDEII